MSKVSQELKALLYLNQRYTRTNWITIKEIADYLEVSDRQARRYLEDLNSIKEIDIETKLGRDGGYKLRSPLDKGIAMPENIVLALSIAMKRNERIENVLSSLPNYVIADSIEGDNQIGNELLDNLELLISVIQNQKEITFDYKKEMKGLYVQPYKIVLTNHTYYLYGTYKDALKRYDVNLISNIKKLGSFKPNKEIISTINSQLSRYGIKNGFETTLSVKCKDLETLMKFDKYFEGNGKKDEVNLIYTVTSNSENELYYPLFRISTKSYEFLDKEFKEKYIKYLENQIRSINHDVK